MRRPAAILASTSALATACAVPPIAAAGASPPLAPPRLPVTSYTCPARPISTIDIERCEQRKIAALDSQINALDRMIFAHLRGVDLLTHRVDHAFPADYGRRAFITGERAWLTYRTAFCLSEGNIAEGGTTAGIDAVYCEASVTSQHVDDLEAFYKALERH